MIPDSDAEDVARAVNAAREAFKPWASKSAQDRAQILHRVADGIQERLEEFAVAESRDQGKPLSLARMVRTAPSQRASAEIEC